MFGNHPIKILFIIDHLGLGGAQGVVFETIKHLNKDKYIPIVCNLRGESYMSSQMEAIGVKVLNLNQAKFNPWAVLQITKIILQERIDLIHTHLFKANTLGRLAAIFSRKPVICHCHINDEKDQKRWQAIVDKLLCHFTDKIVPVSYSAANYNLKVKKIKPSKVKLILNPVDLSKFTRCSQKEVEKIKSKISARKYVIGTMVRLSEQKGTRYLIEAIKKIPEKDITCLIVGDGPLKDQLMDLSHRLDVQDQVVFTGYQEHVTPFYCCMDIIVFPSLYEGLPMVLLESMALGIPIVATNVDGFQEVIEDGKTGLLVPVKDSSLLAEKIALLLKNRELALSLAEEAKRAVKKFDSPKVASHVEEVYEEVLRSRHIR